MNSKKKKVTFEIIFKRKVRIFHNIYIYIWFDKKAFKMFKHFIEFQVSGKLDRSLKLILKVAYSQSLFLVSLTSTTISLVLILFLICDSNMIF